MVLHDLRATRGYLRIQLIDGLKVTHDAGYCHNDIKLENICVGKATNYNKNCQDLHKVTLIDYGLAKKYLDSHGRHIP